MSAGSEVGPLAGTRILEFGQVIAGNFAGLLLADLGAEVIKIESASGDPARSPSVAELNGESALHLTLNRGKKSVVLDLKSDEGQGLFHDMVRSSDAVLDNFRAGVLQRLGADHDTLREINPSIVSVSVSGFGQDGPERERPAYDLIIQALSGHMSITGEPDAAPVRMGAPMADFVGGMFGALAVLAGLLDRQRQGVGRAVDIAMLDALVLLLGYDATVYLNTNRLPERLGTAHSYMVPYQGFSTSDGEIVVVSRDDAAWVRLCAALNRPDLLDDSRAETNVARVQNRDWVVSEVAATLTGLSTREAMRRLTEHDVPAAPVQDFQSTFSDPQVIHREVVRSFEDELLGEVHYVTSPARFSGWKPAPVRPPRLGEHTVAVLQDQLGLDPSRIRALIERGVVAQWTAEDDGKGG